MGFLDDLKKNLGFAEKDDQKTQEQQPPEQATTEAAREANVEAPSPSPANPQVQAAVAQQNAAGVTEVVVEPGDTLRGIAVQYGVDLKALTAVNADIVPNPEVIYPGQVLRLP